MRVPSVIRRLVPPSVYLRMVAYHDCWAGEFELRLLRRIADPNRNAVDVGTNYGIYSYFLSRVVPQVFAFEPNPALGRFIARSARKNVTLLPYALSDQPGTAILNIPLDAHGEVHGLGSLSVVHPCSSAKGVSVRTSTLDSFGLSNVGFIKIDVEGHEMHVLRGGVKTIAANQPRLLIEMDREHIGGDLQREFDVIAAMGYEGWFYWCNRLYPLRDFDGSRHQRQTSTPGPIGQYVRNFFFIHNKDDFALPAQV